MEWAWNGHGKEWTWKGVKSKESKLDASNSVQGDYNKRTFLAWLALITSLERSEKEWKRNENTTKERK